MNAKAAVIAQNLPALAERLRALQVAFDRTGGLHAAGLFAPDGRLVAVREVQGPLPRELSDIPSQADLLLQNRRSLFPMSEMLDHSPND